MKARDYQYDPKTGESLKTHKALIPFAETPEDLKEANRLNLRDNSTKLVMSGYIMIPARSNEHAFTFPGGDLECLADVEHNRWARSKFHDSWFYAPETDMGKKLHKCLVLWEKLPKNEKEKDYDLVRGISTIPAQAVCDCEVTQLIRNIGTLAIQLKMSICTKY